MASWTRQQRTCHDTSRIFLCGGIGLTTVTRLADAGASDTMIGRTEARLNAEAGGIGARDLFQEQDTADYDNCMDVNKGHFCAAHAFAQAQIVKE